MTTGAWVLGLINGLTIGLLAVGLVLVFKSNRFLNLAHAQLGTLPALLLAKWVIDWGWNWWVAFLAAVTVGIGTGVLVERMIVRRLRARTSSSVRFLLLSLGVSQLLLALTYVPALGPDNVGAVSYPQPFQSNVMIGGVRLMGMSVLTAGLVPVLVAALACFMRYSIAGKQIRAAATNPEAARLCGVSVTRVSALSWALAGGFAAVAAVLQAPTQASFNVASLGPYLLMLTLGAAAIGAFVSLPAALAGGVLLGLVNQLVAAETSSGTKAQLAVFIVILLIVLVRGRAIGRVFDSSGADCDDIPVTRVPTALRGVALIRQTRAWAIALAMSLAVVCPFLPFFESTSNRFLLSLILVYALLGVALTVLVGWGGQVSLGTFAVVGLAAFLTARWSADGWTLSAILLVAGLVGAAAMVLVGLPALRVRGMALAVTTLGFAVIATEWLYRQSWVGSSQPFGRSVDPPSFGLQLGTLHSQLAVYFVALGALAAAAFAARALRTSSPGRLILAVRDNERSSAAFGANPAAVKLAVLALSGFLAGVAGVLWALAWRSVSPTQFTADVSIAIIAVPVIGGLGSIAGAVASAVVLYGMTFFVGPHVAGVFGDFGHNIGFQLFLAGAGVVSTLLFVPTGIAGAVQARWQRYLDRRAASSTGVAAPDAELALCVRGIHVGFGGIVALDEPDIEVRPGEIVGLIGTNGAGKTTLMNVVSGVIRPDRGSVRSFGAELVDLAPDLRLALGLGRSFQDATLFAGLTVTETIQVALSQQNKVGLVSAMLAAPWARADEAATRRVAEDIVRRFGLEPWADARTAELSTGTRRICELAAQVAAKPRLILLDEPTAGVAQREAEAFGPLLREIRDELDCSILIVEHDMPLLMNVCDRMYALEAGHVIAEGTPEEIRSDPVVVASYLGLDVAAIARSGLNASS